MEAVIPYLGDRPFYTAALVLFILLAVLWNYLRKRKNISPAPVDAPKPLPITFGFTDCLKAFISWLFLFMRIFDLPPGLYFIGARDDQSPLLVTANNFLTVFLLARRIGDRNVRLLLIDTDGINVWCAAGKGRFSAEEVMEKASRYGLKHESKRTTLILPKFSMAGVCLKTLRKNGFRPIIGPLYAKDVPAYLDGGTFRDRKTDMVRFGLQSRAFTALPTAFQFFYYFLGVYVIGLGFLPGSIIWAAAALAFIYPIVFPWLPGRLFSVKGLSLAVLASIASLTIVSGFGDALWWVVFIFGTSVFIALSYTGNSAVSNYTSVRKETAKFLPLVLVLYIALIPITIFM